MSELKRWMDEAQQMAVELQILTAPSREHLLRQLGGRPVPYLGDKVVWYFPTEGEGPSHIASIGQPVGNGPSFKPSPQQPEDEEYLLLPVAMVHGFWKTIEDMMGSFLAELEKDNNDC